MLIQAKTHQVIRRVLNITNINNDYTKVVTIYPVTTIST